MKRVCHITTVHPRYDNRIFQKECKSLAENGYETYLIVNDELADEKIDNVSIISIRKKRRNRILRMLFSPWEAYKEAKKLQADLYHLHDPELLLIANKLMKKSHVLFDSHEFTAEQILEKVYIPQLLRYVLSKIYKYLERKIISQIDGVVAPCTYAGKDYFEGCYKKIAYVNNVPVLSNLQITHRPYAERKREVLYLGGITLQRGAKVMVEAAAQANIRLSMGGEFSPLKLKNELEEMEEYASVDYLGILNQKQVQKVLSDSKIGICMLQDFGQYGKLDNLPTKIYEYMAAGMPVIASDFPYYKKIIEGNGIGICVNPLDTDAIVQALRYLIEHEEEADKMGLNGKRIVEDKLNWEYEKKSLFELYQKVLYE